MTRNRKSLCEVLLAAGPQEDSLRLPTPKASRQRGWLCRGCGASRNMYAGVDRARGCVGRCERARWTREKVKKRQQEEETQLFFPKMNHPEDMLHKIISHHLCFRLHDHGAHFSTRSHLPGYFSRSMAKGSWMFDGTKLVAQSCHAGGARPARLFPSKTHNSKTQTQ